MPSGQMTRRACCFWLVEFEGELPQKKRTWEALRPGIGSGSGFEHAEGVAGGHGEHPRCRRECPVQAGALQIDEPRGHPGAHLGIGRAVTRLGPKIPKASQIPTPRISKEHDVQNAKRDPLGNISGNQRFVEPCSEPHKSFQEGSRTLFEKGGFGFLEQGNRM